MTEPERPNLLYVVHRTPYPLDKGERIRAFHVLRHLSKRAAIHLACLADEPFSAETTAMLGRFCERLAVVPLGGSSRWLRAGLSLAGGRTVTEGAFESPLLGATLRAWANETRFAACIASASSVAPFLRLPELRGVPAVVDLIDVDSQKWFDYAAASGFPLAWLYRTEGRRLRGLERSIIGWARAVTLVSDAEVRVLARFCPTAKVHAIPCGVDLHYFAPPASPILEQGCVFVGALDYRPNVDAACWFCREAWPEIRRRNPDAQFRIVGRRPAAAVRRLAAVPGVEVIGQVPDVRPYLARGAVSVNPLRIARGQQNKVIEAMAMGKAVVASPQALAGLGGSNVPALCANSAAEWIDMVTNLLEQPGERRRLGTSARRYVEAHHDRDVCLRPFESLLGLSAESVGAMAPGCRG